MSMAYGFYWGIFYPQSSPEYKPPDELVGSCFAAVGQPENYQGFLYQTAELLADNILYA